MKYIFVFICLFAGTLTVKAKTLQADTILVNGTKFLFVRSTLAGQLNTIDTILKVYRIENGQRSYLLTQNIHTEDADCNSYFIDYGSYEISGDSIIFKTEFNINPNMHVALPVSQKQIYIVKDDGKLILIYDRSEMEDGTWRNNM
jgi:hypothetical protein